MIYATIKSQFQAYALPSFVLVALFLGGTSQYGQINHLWIQFAAALMITLFWGWTDMKSWPKLFFSVVLLFGLISAWTIVQLIPLSADIWADLSGRQNIALGLKSLGFDELPALPISLAPEKSFAALLGFLPPIAIVITSLVLGWRKGLTKLLWIIPIVGAVSALIGMGQLFVGPNSPLYFYDQTNDRFPVGLFSNVNHQATFSLMCLPFAAAHAGKLRRRWYSLEENLGEAVGIGLLFVLNLIGVLAAGSLAGYVLLVPVLAMSGILITRKRRGGNELIKAAALTCGVVLGAILIAANPIFDGIGETSLADSGTSRIEIWQTSIEIGKDHGITGIGPGAYEDVYRLYDDPDLVTSRYVNHAHNDYLELWLEWGLVGVAAAAALLGVIGFLYYRTWFQSSDEYSRFRRAASIGLFVVILHSSVDYPARAPAIAVLCAICFAMMIVPRRSASHTVGADGAEDQAKNITL